MLLAFRRSPSGGNPIAATFIGWRGTYALARSVSIHL
jgi:hypothetical protein